MINPGRPKGSKKNGWKYLTERQLADLTGAIRREKNLRDGVMFGLTLYLGLRVQELVNIKLSDIEAESREITIQGIKSGRKRAYPDIEEKLWKKLQRWTRKLGKNETYLFPSPAINGQPISTQAVKDLFKKYAAMVKLPGDYSIHSLRHTCAMLKAKDNDSPIKIMHWLRHKSVMSTQKYFERVVFEGEAEEAKRVFGSYM